MEEEDSKYVGRLSMSRPVDRRSSAKYNIISRLFLLWIEPLFWLGCHRPLGQNDLYAHPEEADSKKLLMRFNKYWKKEICRKLQGKSPRLLVAILKCFWAKLIIQGLLLFSEVIILIVQSVLLGYLTDQFTNSNEVGMNTTNMSNQETIPNNAYYYATGLSGTAFIFALVLGHTYLVAYKNGMISRIAVTGAIYQKILSLNLETVGQLSSGHIINLASNDVQRLDLAFIFVHTVWIAPLHLGVVTYLIYLEISWYAFIVTGIVCLQVPLQILLARLYSYLRLKSAKFTDHRVRIMKELITGIRVIKMYTWEYAFRKNITNTRRQESGFVLQAGLIRAIGLGFMITFINIVTLFTFAVYTSTGGQLSPRKVFISISLILNLRLTTVHFFIQNVLGVVEAKVAATRIQKLLEMDEFVHNNQVKNATGLPLMSNWRHLLCNQDSVIPEITVNNLTVSWSNNDFKPALKNISFEVNQMNKLLAVIGPIGSGKVKLQVSTLLYSLLNELPSTDGKIIMNGKVSYASQDPWVFAATIRENILFGEKFNRLNYEKVLKACALDKDMEKLEKGDLTLVGERGVTLSGGQKARVNLARAVYRDADIYLLDDPLSAVDSAVGTDIFNRCLLKFLEDKLTILATHQIHFAIMANKILVLKNGEATAYGSHTKLMATGFDVTQFHRRPTKREQEARRKSRMSVCPTFPYIEFLDNLTIGMDGNRQGSVQSSSRLRRGAITSPMKFVDNKIDNELFGQDSSCFFDANSTSWDNSPEEEDTVQQPPEESEHGALSTKVYVSYFRAGGILATLAVIILFIVGEAGIVISEWWLSNWAVCQASEVNSSTLCSMDDRNRLQVYSGLTLFTVFVNFARTIGLVYLCVNASQVLHDKMFKSILQSPVLFFDSNPIGRILNRFSKDVGFLDDLLPYMFCEFFLFLFRCFAILVTTLITNPLVSLPAFFLLFAMLFIRWYFLKTSREIKRLEALARSPVYSHLSTTLQGLPTIRAFRKQNIALKIFQGFQNQHTQGWYLYLVTTSWLGMRVDTLSALFVTVFTFMSVGLASFTNDLSIIGLGLTYVISLSGLFQYVVRQSAAIEDLMISGERVMAYNRLKSEASENDFPILLKPSSNWPSKGAIKMSEVSFQYNPEVPPVLRDLRFSVNPSEKIGIVGRTGAGKSSLISVLYRLAEFEGQVTIDGVDIQSIGLHDLRKNMSIIPQDSVLFSGTVKHNLDPFNEYSDMQLWKSLEQVQLRDFVSQMEGQLHGEVLEGGSNFSVGQRQLVCLARALLRKKRILILDEATANVDPKTDCLIQEIIRDAFSDCTVLTIAHRLNTIMDSDRILVMENGEVVEFDKPLTLINKGAHFAQMVEKTGVNTAHNLCQLAVAAEQKFKNVSGHHK